MSDHFVYFDMIKSSASKNLSFLNAKTKMERKGRLVISIKNCEGKLFCVVLCWLNFRIEQPQIEQL